MLLIIHHPTYLNRHRSLKTPVHTPPTTRLGKMPIFKRDRCILRCIFGGFVCCIQSCGFFLPLLPYLAYGMFRTLASWRRILHQVLLPPYSPISIQTGTSAPRAVSIGMETSLIAKLITSSTLPTSFYFIYFFLVYYMLLFLYQSWRSCIFETVRLEVVHM